MQWEFIEQIQGYYFWKYQDKDEKNVYNVTTKNEPPQTTAGYYSYGYLLSVKGITNTLTLNKLFKNI